eukprot:TRINITY_DN23372_c0_g1_i1.p1 TRINITY_DN23372_c0_g1~~TRINITY_DN23372_c0_g1_i1.p1  ORF type:complete len:317 (+),score=98.18 TRINITY_DN23372_c0_g1_i1:67-951(+)
MADIPVLELKDPTGRAQARAAKKAANMATGGSVEALLRSSSAKGKKLGGGADVKKEGLAPPQVGYEARRWADLGPEVDATLVKTIPPVMNEGDVEFGSALEAWFLNEEASRAGYSPASLLPGKRTDVSIAESKVSIKELRRLGIGYWKVLLHDYSTLAQITRDRVYKQMDEVKLHQTAKGEAVIEKWFAEHFNPDEHLFMVIEGSCYVDIRDKQDKWIRMHLTAGDLIATPPGLYHRITLDEDDYVWVMRLIRDSSRWLPVYRSERRADSHPARLKYVNALRQYTVASETGFML